MAMKKKERKKEICKKKGITNENRKSWGWKWSW